MKAKDRRAVMAQLSCCLYEGQSEIGRLAKCGKKESELLLLEMLKVFVAEIEEKPLMRQFFKWVFYRKS